MSHQPERKEKDCLNCGTEVMGRYCQQCGQENIVTHQNFWSLTRHFVYDIFHFDGKFFDTLRFMLTRPGHVAREYASGRRQSYLDPIRMYLFTSAFFFLLFFTINPEPKLVGLDEPVLTRQQRIEEASRTAFQLQQNPADTALGSKLAYLLDSNYVIRYDSPKTRVSQFPIIVNGKTQTGVVQRDELDSIKSGVSWLDNSLEARWRRYKSKFGGDTESIVEAGVDKFLHQFPILLFISLPFFALILKLLYIRRRQFFYSDHAVFTLYQYILTFILLLFAFLFNKLAQYTGIRQLTLLTVLLTLSGAVYLFKGMRRFYGQSRGKTLLKFLGLNLLAFLLMVVLTTLFLIFSFLQL